VSTAGYSGKTLTQKLGVKPGDEIRVIDPPDHFARLLAPLPDGARITLAGDTMPAMVVGFARTVEDLAHLTPRVTTLPAPGGALWISWPKKSSAQFIDLTEDGVRARLLPIGWVDVKVCAVDENWSGLKFLRRRVSP
jgi:hypothetical protein